MRSSSRIRKILTLQIPPHPRDAIVAHDPELGQILSNPRKVLHSIVRLHPRDQNTKGIQDVHARAGTSQDIAVGSNLKSIGDPVLRQPDWTLPCDVRAIVDTVVLVHSARACLVPWATWRTIWRDVTVDRACVRDVDVFAIRRQCDAVGLLEGVVNNGNGTSGRVEAV
jgi:hypothetical protein